MLLRFLSFLFLCSFAVYALPYSFSQENNAESEQAFSDAEGNIEPYDLRLEYLTEPKGIDELKPRFSWKLQSDENGQTQTAYRIFAERTERISADISQPVEQVWDSGKVAGNIITAEYAGKPLQSKSEYVWKLTVWDKNGKPSLPAVSSFSTGILTPDGWKAKWIGLDRNSLEDDDKESGKISLDGAAWIWTNANAMTAPVGQASFRKTFEISNGIIKETTFAFAADNGYTAYLNGKIIGTGSSFKTANLIDVAGMLKTGKNVLAVNVSNHGDAPNPAGLIGVLRIRYGNGTETILKTDASWKGIDGVPAGSETETFDDSAWKTAVKIADLGGGPWGEIAVNTSRPSPPARYLYKKFDKKKGVVRASAYISGLGYYKLEINGKKIGNSELDPVLTDYDKRVPYVTYEIEPQEIGKDIMEPAITENIINVTLGNGRYYAPRSADPAPTRTFGYPKLLFQLEIKYADGSTETIVSDETWQLTTHGMIRDNNDYDGEIYDFSKNEETKRWENARIVEAPKGKLAAQMMPPMRVVEEFEPVSVKEVSSGVWIFDFGVNLVGNCRLDISPMMLRDTLTAGTKIKIRHAETLQEDGNLYVANLRGAKCQDIYIASGNECLLAQADYYYIPSFTYHGFRYAELTGLPQNFKPSQKTLTARAINTDLPKVGKFKTSNETINAVFRNVVRGTQGNYLSIPTDCPQRDERQGWQGDRAGESKGEMFMFDNVTLYSKWLIDIEDSQRENGDLSDVCPNYWSLYSSNVTWPSAFTIIPDSIYTMYGDKRPIERHYEAMKRWLIGHLGQFVKDGIIDKDNYGDWCVPPEKPELIHSQDPARKTSKEILATSYYIYNLDLLTKYAKMLGKDTEAADFVQKATEMRKAFNEKFLNKETGKHDNGTQTSCVLPLYFNIVPDDMKQKVFATLVNNIENTTKNHIGTGLIGGQWLNRVLSDNGKAEIPYLFATNKDYPSWGYMVEKGATTIWELWNGNTADPAMNSGNHVMLVGDLIIWFYEYLAGIKADESRPGFEHIIMKPLLLGDLKFVDAEYDSIRGVIKSKWNRDGNNFHWEIEIPLGSTATVILPDGKKIENVPSGMHTFDTVLQ
ncbi:hypothetical protein FACS1894214_0290 [Planctomycetales bacterium]|nr:hypothetical protein FACS1894214_0290 [Planctomycetales bacterium]